MTSLRRTRRVAGLVFGSGPGTRKGSRLDDAFPGRDGCFERTLFSGSLEIHIQTVRRHSGPRGIGGRDHLRVVVTLDGANHHALVEVQVQFVRGVFHFAAWIVMNAAGLLDFGKTNGAFVELDIAPAALHMQRAAGECRDGEQDHFRIVLGVDGLIGFNVHGLGIRSFAAPVEDHLAV